MTGTVRAQPVEPRADSRVPLPRRVGSLLFFLMLFVPTTYQPVKLGLLTFCLVALIAARPATLFNPRLAIGTLLVALFGTYQVIYGELRGTPGAISTATVWILWPLVFFVLASGISDMNHLRSLVRTMIWAAIGIGVYGCLMVLALTDRAPTWTSFKWIELGQGFYYGNGVIALTLNSFTSLLFLIPFMVALLATWPRDRAWPVSPWLVYVALALTTALALLSGRRALFLAVLTSPVLAFCSAKLMRARNGRWHRTVAAGAVVAIGAVLIFHINVGLTVQYLTSSATKSQGDRARVGQFAQLIAGWKEHPFFGAGLGAVADGPVRSVETPWAYELSYVALLFQIGVVGLLVYSMVALRLSRNLISVARDSAELRPWAIPVLAGYISFLIANASNPYLLKFDSMYVLFLPVALVNVAWARRSRLGHGELKRAEPANQSPNLMAAVPPLSCSKQASRDRRNRVVSVSFSGSD